MPRIVPAVCLSMSLALALSACADSTEHKHPPQDPPDYHGVPTDMTPPSMITPSSPAPAAKPQ
ncbi:hypothetical protein [Candidatus Burkholderia verschuerenii]|uniref:hypothetical protein n=1 Tax=Candidatus Burkholderia verschuerenii TaxID=242163 RepID=UPI00067DB4C7|nr:hypothetical protein [Candidatus Burkholderia verschuerenii]